MQNRRVLNLILFSSGVLVVVLGGFNLLAPRGCRCPSPTGQVRNNLTQLGIAMHSYSETRGTLPPPAVYSKGAKPLLSWRVAILPYIEEDRLYAKFHLDEPWHSAHNIGLLKEMPFIFRDPRNPSLEPEQITRLRVFVGSDTPFNGPKGIPLTEITDGTNNTFLIVEAAEAVPWTKPAELAYSPECSLPALGCDPSKGFLAALADGSVVIVPKGSSEEQLRAAITRNGGEGVVLPWQ